MRKSHQRPRLPLRRSLPAAIGMVLASGGLQAGTFNVTSVADSGPGSFREALAQANTSPGADLIDFSAIAGQTITLTSSLPLITDELVLQGSEVTIDGDDQHGCLTAYKADLTVEDMTITRCTGSYFMQSGTPAADTRAGGGIQTKYGSLTVTGSTISNNSVGDEKYGSNPSSIGGGILVIGESLTVSDSIISGNSAALGGGIIHMSISASSAPEGTPTGGQLLITDSQISGNSAATNIGGLMAVGQASSIGIDRSEITDNQAGDRYGGFALYSDETSVTLSNSTISGNSALDYQVGGGLIRTKYPSTSELLNNTVSYNSAPAMGGLVLSHHGGNTLPPTGDGPSGVVSPITLVGPARPSPAIPPPTAPAAV